MEIIEKSQLPVFGADTFVAHLDGAKIGTLRALYPRISKAMHFPEHFGKNMDALFDCLCDLQGIDIKFKKTVLVVNKAAAFLSKEKVDKKAAALQVLEEATHADNRYDEFSFAVFFVQ
jgi:RNAse (barnase) inhibitor barstar